MNAKLSNFLDTQLGNPISWVVMSLLGFAIQFAWAAALAQGALQVGTNNEVIVFQASLTCMIVPVIVAITLCYLHSRRPDDL